MLAERGALPLLDSPTFLIVNGDSNALTLLEPVLDAANYHVVFVEASRHAYSQIRRTQPNLVILCLDLDDVESYSSTLHGTPLYLAPEILEGRSASLAGDIYAVGVLLFNLVSGRFPYEGTSIAEIRRAHRQGHVVRLDAVRRDLPPAFVDVVMKALQRDPAARYRSATAMREALIRSLGDGDMPPHLFALRRPPARNDLPSVAVLPFLNLRRDPEMDYFCDGLAEELLTALGKVDGLRVAGVDAAYLNSSQTPEERDAVLGDLRADRVRLLYVSPERLVGEGTRLEAVGVDAECEDAKVDVAGAQVDLGGAARALHLPAAEIRRELFGGNHPGALRPRARVGGFRCRRNLAGAGANFPVQAAAR